MFVCVFIHVWGEVVSFSGTGTGISLRILD
jgi:hypothetical protein